MGLYTLEPSVPTPFCSWPRRNHPPSSPPYFHLAFPALPSLPSLWLLRLHHEAPMPVGFFSLYLHSLPLIYFIKHTCVPLHPTVTAICIHTSIQAHMLLVNTNYIKPLLLDAPIRKWWAGKKITLSSWDKACQARTLKAVHQHFIHETPLGIWVTPSPRAESRASNETGGTKWDSAPRHHQSWRQLEMKLERGINYKDNCIVMHPKKFFFPRCFQMRIRSVCCIDSLCPKVKKCERDTEPGEILVQRFCIPFDLYCKVVNKILSKEHISLQHVFALLTVILKHTSLHTLN